MNKIIMRLFHHVLIRNVFIEKLTNKFSYYCTLCEVHPSVVIFLWEAHPYVGIFFMGNFKWEGVLHCAVIAEVNEK